MKKKSVRKKTKRKVTRSSRTTPPFPAYPDWTTSKFWSFIRSGIRSKFNRWPPKYEVLQAARRNVKHTKTRQRYEYKCAECLNYFPQKEVEVDHKVPAGSLKCSEDLAGFVERVFCSKDELQVLCKPCHKIKTAQERKIGKLHNY